MTGNCIAHPLLITLANVHSAIRSSISSHAFSLLALFPIPNFIGVKKAIRGILENRCSTGNNAEGQGSGPLRDALCLLEATRLKGMTP